jgi:hypothetical protein
MMLKNIVKEKKMKRLSTNKIPTNLKSHRGYGNLLAMEVV